MRSLVDRGERSTRYSPIANKYRIPCAATDLLFRRVPVFFNLDLSSSLEQGTSLLAARSLDSLHFYVGKNALREQSSVCTGRVGTVCLAETFKVGTIATDSGVRFHVWPSFICFCLTIEIILELKRTKTNKDQKKQVMSSNFLLRANWLRMDHIADELHNPGRSLRFSHIFHSSPCENEIFYK